ncbi:alpha/beta fold hydrolase [bacterium]|nr:alpha/beta fold hydrolase [bacterium]
MTPCQRLTTAQGRSLAYHQSAGAGPGIVFLGGYRSDMGGTKALALEAWALAQGRAFLRFDYAGHGQSSGRFEDLGIADWIEDARAALSLTEGRQVLVGSSMGGWIALALARALPERIAGLIGIAAAPDFTEDSLLPSLTADERAVMDLQGRIERPSAYAAEPYVFTRKLIEQGRQHLILRSPLRLPFPTRFLQGTADEDVLPSVALRLLDHAEGPDIRLTLVQGADHRFSTPACLRLIETSVAEVSA